MTGEIRLLLGQTLLTDDKTFQQLNLKEGDILHMVLEPARDISFTIKIPTIGERKFSFSNDCRISQILQHLLDKKLLSGPLKEQVLMLRDKQLDMVMPIHVYDIEKHGGVLRVLPVSIGLCIVDEYNDEMYVTVNTKLHTILDVKKKIAGNCKTPNSYHALATYQAIMTAQVMQLQQLQQSEQIQHLRQLQGQMQQLGMTTSMNLTDFLPKVDTPIQPKVYENPEHMRLYVQQGEVYKPLYDDYSIKDSGVEHNSKLYLIYYGWGPGRQGPQTQYVMSNKYARFTKGELNHQNQPATQGGEIDFVGRPEVGQTLLSAALKIQEQLDVPVENMQIYTCRTSFRCNLHQHITAEDCQQGFVVVY